MSTSKKIDLISASIVYQFAGLGLYHYNKLAYLFEYFFRKNFGCSYSEENFIKIPHGPVIHNYKQQVKSLCRSNVLLVDIDELEKVRTLDTDFNCKVPIYGGKLIDSFLIPERQAMSLLNQVIEKFGGLSVADLEEVVYSTSPVKNYLTKVTQGFKSETGGYILTDCHPVRKLRTPKAKGRLLAMEHDRKYPHINWDTQSQLTSEFVYLEELRPEWPKA